MIKSEMEGGDITLPMITQTIEGQGGISHQEFDRYLRRPQNVDADPDTFVETFREDVTDR